MHNGNNNANNALFQSVRLSSQQPPQTPQILLNNNNMIRQSLILPKQPPANTANSTMQTFQHSNIHFNQQPRQILVNGKHFS